MNVCLHFSWYRPQLSSHSYGDSWSDSRFITSGLHTVVFVKELSLTVTVVATLYFFHFCFMYFITVLIHKGLQQLYLGIDYTVYYQETFCPNCYLSLNR